MSFATKLKPLLRENKSALLFVVLLLVFRGAVADWHPVPTGSMKPTILEGDVVWQNKLAYDLKIPFTDITLANLGTPERGDIVVINSSAADLRLIKRLIGLPGDEIALINNRLFINGVAANYTDSLFADASTPLRPIRKVDTENVTYAWESIENIPTHAVSVKPTSQQHRRDFSTVVPEGHYFFMGDNRDSSADSRYYGSMPRNEIRGKATHTLISMNMLDKYKPRFERFFSGLY